MPLLRRILVPFDHSELSEAALDYALALARPAEASVLVFHACGEVIPRHEHRTEPAGRDPPQAAGHDTRDAGQALAEALHGRRERSDVELEPIVRWVSPTEGINRVAAETGADLLVMGTHGRRGLSRAFLGSVAESVLRTSARPVLTLRARRDGPPRHLLVATDFGAPSARALAFAVDLARLTRGRITLAHVFATPLPILTGETSLVTAEVVDRIVVSSRAALGDAVAQYRDSGIAVEPLLREGTASRAIPDIAHEVGADLVVVGTRGRTGLARAVLGSVAEELLRTVEVPVLVLRGDG